MTLRALPEPVHEAMTEQSEAIPTHRYVSIAAARHIGLGRQVLLDGCERCQFSLVMDGQPK